MPGALLPSPGRDPVIPMSLIYVLISHLRRSSLQKVMVVLTCCDRVQAPARVHIGAGCYLPSCLPSVGTIPMGDSVILSFFFFFLATDHKTMGSAESQNGRA